MTKHCHPALTGTSTYFVYNELSSSNSALLTHEVPIMGVPFKHTGKALSLNSKEEQISTTLLFKMIVLP
jgi:hypothetical protein